MTRLSIVKDITKNIFVESVFLPNSKPIPNIENFRYFNIDYLKACEFLDSESMIGSSSGFSSNSMNHQILQGLKIASLLNLKL